MKERVRFITEWERGELTMLALCRKYGVSRQTGYKWVRRYQEMGRCLESLRDFPRTPHYHPWTTDEDTVDLLVRARKRHPTWGPRKLREWLLRRSPDLALPAPSTIGAILRRHGLTKARHRRRRTPPSEEPLAHCTHPNVVWCTDFKGHFQTGDGTRCYPLTLMDGHSRFLVRCEALGESSAKVVRPVFESAFREYGLPDAIRSDNGTPFATKGAGGLSRLSCWWIKLGIRHERIEPGKPQQNGRHERMHRTLKQETASPPRSSMRAQQRAFDRFRKEYNEERPHEALNGNVPAQVYIASQRALSEPEPRMDYEYDCDVVRLDKNGKAKWGRRTIHISPALAHEDVVFEPIDERCWEVYFGPVLLGFFDATRPGQNLSAPRCHWRRKWSSEQPGTTSEGAHS